MLMGGDSKFLGWGEQALIGGGVVPPCGFEWLSQILCGFDGSHWLPLVDFWWFSVITGGFESFFGPFW